MAFWCSRNVDAEADKGSKSSKCTAKAAKQKEKCGIFYFRECLTQMTEWNRAGFGEEGKFKNEAGQEGGREESGERRGSSDSLGRVRGRPSGSIRPRPALKSVQTGLF